MVKGYYLEVALYICDGEDYVWTIDPGNGGILETSSELTQMQETCHSI